MQRPAVCQRLFRGPLAQVRSNSTSSAKPPPSRRIASNWGGINIPSAADLKLRSTAATNAKSVEKSPRSSASAPVADPVTSAVPRCPEVQAEVASSPAPSIPTSTPSSMPLPLPVRNQLSIPITPNRNAYSDVDAASQRDQKSQRVPQPSSQPPPSQSRLKTQVDNSSTRPGNEYQRQPRNQDNPPVSNVRRQPHDELHSPSLELVGGRDAVARKSPTGRKIPARDRLQQQQGPPRTTSGPRPHFAGGDARPPYRQASGPPQYNWIKGEGGGDGQVRKVYNNRPGQAGASGQRPQRRPFKPREVDLAQRLEESLVDAEDEEEAANIALFDRADRPAIGKFEPAFNRTADVDVSGHQIFGPTSTPNVGLSIAAPGDASTSVTPPSHPRLNWALTELGGDYSHLAPKKLDDCITPVQELGPVKHALLAMTGRRDLGVNSRQHVADIVKAATAHQT